VSSKSIRLALLFSFFLFVLPIYAATPEYPSPDAGVLIYSVGSLDIAMNFDFQYKRVRLSSGEPASDWRGTIECKCVGFVRARMKNADYTGRETGKVIVRRLPPGHYEIYDFGFAGTMGPMSVHSSSKTKFVIPFEIKSGQATYIGSFVRAPSLGTSMQRVVGAAGYFIISDQSERDLAIARARQTDLPPVTNSVFDVSILGHPAILAKEPK
jgi:hypothetical protein